MATTTEQQPLPTDGSGPKIPAPGEFVRVFLKPVLWLFLVPAVALAFVSYGEHDFDREILSAIEGQIAKSDRLTAEQKPQALAFYRAHPPSEMCGSSDDALAAYRTDVCPAWDTVWQFFVADRAARLAIAMGLFAVLAAAGLGFLAFRSRGAQYWSFMLGWRLLTLVSGVEIVVQASLALWLSYWMTALLMHVYVIKLIVLVGCLAAAAVWVALKALFKKLPEPPVLAAEPVSESDAPKLWARLRELATTLGIEPPRHIVAGIDDNFFVTESGIRLVGGRLEGRALFVSLPLLRVLAPAEASAVFAHELAHFLGGDTAASAKLWPMLVRYDQYMGELARGGVTAPAFFLMRMFRAIFEVALAREQRERELVADRTAARVTSPDDLARALLKTTAYSAFRAETEQALFAQQTRHSGELGIGQRIEAGLAAHVASAQFVEALRQARTPHPFDTHPLLDERIRNVGSAVALTDAAALMKERPSTTWAAEVTTGAEIEKKLWGAYEARFQQEHEQSLAYRYLPSTDEERVLVQRYFPAQSFEMKGARRLGMDHEKLDLPDGTPGTLRFEEIKSARVNSGNFSEDLELTYLSVGAKSATVKINLKHLGPQAERFKNEFGRYWQRSQIARQFVAEQQRKQQGGAAA